MSFLGRSLPTQKRGHFENFGHQKALIQKDLLEFKKSIYSKYQEAAANIPVQRADVRKHSEQLTTALNKQREALHTAIDTIVQGLKTEIDEMDKQHLAAIEKQENKINETMNEIKQVILDLKSLLDTGDVGLVSKYKSRIEEFRKLPSKLKISLPNFLPQKINREQLLEQFGSLSPLFIETKERGYTVPSAGAESSPPARPLLDVPRLITDIPTTGFEGLYSVSCLSDEEIWISGNCKIMELYNLKGELLMYVRTKSGNWPEDIAVTRSGGLVYADKDDRSINLVSGTQIQTLITLQGWKPFGLCSTSSGDLLVIMRSDDDDDHYDDDDYYYDDDDDDDNNGSTKVVRFSGSTETQTIQQDDQGNPLYSSGLYKYLSENRNLDICVADSLAGAVVVVSAGGKLRFRYTGPPSIPQESFNPRGITTDSQGNILTSDCNNLCIHIIDQDGHFLCFIHNCGFQNPWGLCVDSRDNLFVAELDTCKVPKIQYYNSSRVDGCVTCKQC
uniref:Uncharacterized protein LOC111112429 n=1 Tax=Crassostrea virginica TaxID=6565 RepID=A0A8B8BQJ8_CRAVI|nr:uncharacterized protein LOC111112429 [Crassostrea virginica]